MAEFDDPSALGEAAGHGELGFDQPMENFLHHQWEVVDRQLFRHFPSIEKLSQIVVGWE